MTDYTKLVEALRFCARWHRADDALANAEQAADAIERLIAERDEAKTDLAAVGRAFIREIEQHEPKQGEWELIDGAEPMRWGCSRCKYLSWETSNYCPRCGAKMEVQDG